MQNIADTLKARERKYEKNNTVNSYTVNSSNKDLNTVNSRDGNNEKTLAEDIAEVLQKHNMPKEGVARYVAELLDDLKSLRYYEILVKENRPEFLMEWAHYVKDRARQGKVRTKPAVYFRAVIERQGAKVKFKKS